MANQPQPPIETDDLTATSKTTTDNKFGTSVFKKWIYAKFDAKLIVELVQKDIYLNPKLSILLPTLNANGKKQFLSATLDLKSLQALSKELDEATKILQAHFTKTKDS